MSGTALRDDNLEPKACSDHTTSSPCGRCRRATRRGVSPPRPRTLSRRGAAGALGPKSQMSGATSCSPTEYVWVVGPDSPNAQTEMLKPSITSRLPGPSMTPRLVSSGAVVGLLVV